MRDQFGIGKGSLILKNRKWPDKVILRFYLSGLEGLTAEIKGKTFAKEELKIRSHKFQKIRYLSNNFAGKEAFSKVLGLGFREGVSLREIEILRNENGKPYILLSGNTHKIAERLEIKNINVSITDTNNLSTAFVIGE